MGILDHKLVQRRDRTLMSNIKVCVLGNLKRNPQNDFWSLLKSFLSDHFRQEENSGEEKIFEG